MRVVHCSGCGSFLQPDELRYIVGVHVTLDVDGFVDSEATAYNIAEQLEQRSSSSLGDVFTREMAFTLCVSCSDEFVSDPLNRPQELREPDHGLLQ